jgi:hypothetical protein
MLLISRPAGVVANPQGAAHRFLGWAEEILGIDQELARHINEFQYHVLALAGVSDTALKKTQQAVDQAK